MKVSCGAVAETRESRIVDRGRQQHLRDQCAYEMLAGALVAAVSSSGRLRHLDML